MICNFFDNSVEWGLSKEDVRKLLIFYFVVSWVFMMFRLIFKFFWDSLTVGGLFRFGFISSFLFVIISFIAYNTWDYYNSRKATYSLFKFRDFKKWYALTPEKFIFDDIHYCAYYIHSGTFSRDIAHSRNQLEFYDVTTMYPKTLFDFVQYDFFVLSIYMRVKGIKKAKQKQVIDIQKRKDIIYGNNELIRVMGSIQKDIDKVLKDSQSIIHNETLKMEQLNKSI